MVINMNIPVISGSEGEKAIDVRKLRTDSGYITYDDGYGNTGSCLSDITFINGREGNPASSWHSH